MPSNEDDRPRETPLFRASRRSTGEANAAGSQATDGAANAARAHRSIEMLKRFGALGLSGAMLGRKAAVGSVRGAMPVLEFYSGTTRAEQAEIGAETRAAGLRTLGFDVGEAGVLKKAFGKGVLEALEISSVTHPVYEGAPAYRMHNPEGGLNRPTMAHFIALGAAAAAIWKDWNAEALPVDKPPADLPPEQKTVAYVAIRPGEYQYITTPLQPSEIRSFAMRQRTLNPPQEAVLLRSSEPRVLAPANGGRTMSAAAPAVSSASMAVHAAPSRRMRPAASAQGRGCACGSSSGAGCYCETGSGSRRFSPARYDDDGACASLFDISCETKWRVRECVKIAFCDFLRCLGEQYCETEEPDLGECLDDFLCSILTCLPDAICPPEEPCEPRCPPKSEADCHCNFAVGE